MKRLILGILLTGSLGLLGSALAGGARHMNARILAGKSTSMARPSVGARTQSSQTTAAYTDSLKTAQVSYLKNNQIVVVMEASGDLRGALTLRLERDEAGQIKTGYWALVVSYIEDVEVEGDEDHHNGEEGEPHPGGERLIEKGALSGSVSSGTLNIDTDGKVRSISNLQLSLEKGSLIYRDVTSGSGTVQAEGLGDFVNAKGTLSLFF